MALPTLPRRIALLRETLKCSCKSDEPALSTGDVLIEEYRAIHGRDLKQEYESRNGASSWSRFPEKEYDEKRATADGMLSVLRRRRRSGTRLGSVFTSSTSIDSRRKTRHRAKPPFASLGAAFGVRPSRLG